ncbi:MAG: S-layer homology domain-containing protein, partial [Phascolarctobacterium sp.]|nr:S-layer homology domain-containing protein [Candidatus Phascolarctobacterium equi]
MKKSLVLAMAMAMGVTASAYAANPFSDVPAGHWAYDAVAKLADAGVVDGYGATFGGDKLMTRYEMAQIVAKAMAKGANTDKLAAEFADELDALGVRVAKLEKKVDNVKITGQLRYSYKQEDGTGPQNNSKHAFRTRLFVNGEVNKNWSYTGMLVNEHSFKGDGDEKVALERAYLNGRIGGVKVLAGHYNEFFMCDTILDDMVDGVYAEYGVGNGKVYGLAGKNLHKDLSGGTPSDNDRIYVVGVSQKVGPVDLTFNYFNVDSSRGQEIYNINADWAFAKDFGLTARYMWADEKLNKEADKDGWFAQ